MPSKLCAFPQWIYDSYCWLVIKFPWPTLITTLTISIVFSAAGIYYHGNAFNLEPGEGFETRGTKFSGQRLALNSLKAHISSPSDIFFSNRRKREVNVTSITTTTDFSEPDDFTVDYDAYGVNAEASEEDLKNDPCVQFMAIGNEIQYAYLDAMAKLIFEVSSFDEAFTLPVMRKLCELDSIVDDMLIQYPDLSLRVNPMMRHSLNLPYYPLCFDASTQNLCSELSEENILEAKKAILNCKRNPKDLNCNLRLYEQLFDYILEDGSLAQEPFHLGAIIPINVFLIGDKVEEFYSRLLARLEEHFSDTPSLRGAYFEQKLIVFRHSIIPDTLLGGISFALVLICFLIYSRSIIFTLVVLAAVILSLTVAYSIFTMVLRLEFFPFVNLLTLVLMVSIGADDAFLLLVYFREARRERKHEISESRDVDKEKELDGETLLRASLSHSLLSMFVTSATTAVAFLSNLTSQVVVVRCFGIYAAITIITNYLLVLFLLPPAIIITQGSQNRSYSKITTKCRVKGGDKVFGRLAELFSAGVYKMRFFGVLIMFLSLAFSTLSLWRPGIQLPESNPMQYLRSSHPYEWFDDHQGLFRFDANREARLIINYIRGVNPNRGASLLNPSCPGKFSFSSLSLETLADVRELQDTVTALKAVNPKFANYTMWIDYFMEYIENDACLEDDKCCCHEEKQSFNKTCLLLFAKRNFCPDFPESIKHAPADCPLFDKHKRLKAYYVAIPSQHRLSLAYSDVQKVFKDIEEVDQEIMNKDNGDAYLLLSEPHVTKMYDLLSNIFSSTLISVAISVGVSLIVIILCTRNLMISMISIIAIGSVILNTLAVVIWMGWKINVVEATIIVLTIGLSFDYTLHYAVAHKHADEPSVQMRISSCNQSAGRAVLAGAITSVLAGIPLLFSKTNAFFEIGCFIIVMSLLSLLTATFFFPSLLAIVLDLRFWRRKRVQVQNY